MWTPTRQDELALLREMLQLVDDLAPDAAAIKELQRVAAYLRAPREGQPSSFVEFLQACAETPNVYLGSDGAQSLFGEGAHIGGTQFAYQKEPHRVFNIPMARVPE